MRENNASRMESSNGSLAMQSRKGCVFHSESYKRHLKASLKAS